MHAHSAQRVRSGEKKIVLTNGADPNHTCLSLLIQKPGVLSLNLGSGTITRGYLWVSHVVPSRQALLLISQMQQV